MDDREFGFFDYQINASNHTVYFGLEVDLHEEIENRLSELSKEILSELGLKECIDTLEVDYVDLDFENDLSYVFISWKTPEKEHIIQFVSLRKFASEDVIYKDGKYKAMTFYSESCSEEEAFLKALVKKCPLNK